MTGTKRARDPQLSARSRLGEAGTAEVLLGTGGKEERPCCVPAALSRPESSSLPAPHACFTLQARPGASASSAHRAPAESGGGSRSPAATPPRSRTHSQAPGPGERPASAPQRLPHLSLRLPEIGLLGAVHLAVDDQHVWQAADVPGLDLRRGTAMEAGSAPRGSETCSGRCCPLPFTTLARRAPSPLPRQPGSWELGAQGTRGREPAAASAQGCLAPRPSPPLSTPRGFSWDLCDLRAAFPGNTPCRAGCYQGREPNLQHPPRTVPTD